MKKIILSIFITFSIINSNLFSIDINSNNSNTKCAKLPTEIWHGIVIKLIEGMIKAETLSDIKASGKELYKFSLISKIHAEVVEYFSGKEININGKEIKLKEYYAQRKFELLKKILNELNYSFGWVNHINSQNREGNTALMIAIVHGDKKLAELLIQNGADLNIQNDINDTALIIAAFYNYIEIAKILIQQGANLNIQSNDKNTALMVAASWDHSGIVKILIENGADLDIQNEDGSTALMIAAYYNNIEAAKLLIQNHAKLDIQDKDGNTALKIALDQNNKKISELIKKAHNKNCKRPKKRQKRHNHN